MNERFGLARMSASFVLLTIFLCLLPVTFIGLGIALLGQAPGLLYNLGFALLALFLAIWLWSRPTRFEVGTDAMVIVWPVRQRRIALSEIRRVRVLDVRAFRKIYGWTPRIGVGGLWGIFGWLWSRDAGLIDIHASRLDGWVLIQRSAGHPLVVTPERPEEFAERIAPTGGVG